MKLIYKPSNTLFAMLLFLASYFANAQTNGNQQMAKLNFMIGNWVGTSTSYKNGKINKQVPASQVISYKVDQNIITIDLNSETLKLHTVIYYDDEKQSYLYNPYYNNGSAKYTAILKDDKFIVSPNPEKRFVFQLLEDDSFREYGEVFKDGVWLVYFEDNFKK
ncbi:hypothetical protein [uncultured Polaribacter sp.]|uniref:hypothetical protein n=1 Tax=uncultured Polaribacter sp. TaxID=174711 RepID=UPI0026156AC5|nr:hypothetical protein [uncultured Polaribacter sp.]